MPARGLQDRRQCLKFNTTTTFPMSMGCIYLTYVRLLAPLLPPLVIACSIPCPRPGFVYGRVKNDDWEAARRGPFRSGLKLPHFWFVSFSVLRVVLSFWVPVLVVASCVPCCGSSGQRCARCLLVSASFEDALVVSACSESSVSRRFRRCTDVSHTSRQTSALWPRKCKSSLFQRRVRHRADAERILDNEIIAIIFKNPTPLLAHHARGWSRRWTLR